MGCQERLSIHAIHYNKEVSDTFPKGFFFGASTSSHQVEGGSENDWSEWERAHADRLAQEAVWAESRPGGHFPDHIAHALKGAYSPFTRNNYISGRATDHYHRFKEDFALAAELGHTAHRFSLEWSRIEPEEGVFAEDALRHYREVVRELRLRKIEPFVALWHWTLPPWFAHIGGWESRNAVRYFARYAERVAEALPEVRFWVTVNEPEVWAGASYLARRWPPQKSNVFAYLRVLKNLAEGHRRAAIAIKRIDPSAQIGIAKHNIYFEAGGGTLWNRSLKRLADWWWNEWFLRRAGGTQDFIGINYYFHNRIAGWFGKNKNLRLSDVGWELYPEGMYHVLSDLKRYHLPIYVLENGLADARDSDRAWFIEEHLQQILRAIREGADVRGYFHWSLIDNFEWDKGFWPRFGLIEIDYQTLERKIRPSARTYQSLIERYTSHT